MQPIGFATGAIRKIAHPVSKRAIDICRKLGSEAIEISCLEWEYLDLLFELYRSDFDGFRHVSLHAPTRGVSYGFNKISCYIRDRLYGAHCRINFDNIVLHPDRIENYAVLAGLGLPISLENTDKRKGRFGRPLDFTRAMEFSENTGESIMITLDLAHIFDQDNTMALVDGFAGEFRDKICELHISGFDGHHVPFHQTRQDLIIKACISIDAPIIIESNCKSFRQAKIEIEYVNSILHKIH